MDQTASNEKAQPVSLCQEPMPLRGRKRYTNIPSRDAQQQPPVVLLPFQQEPLRPQSGSVNLDASPSGQQSPPTVLRPLGLNYQSNTSSTSGFLHPCSTDMEAREKLCVPLSVTPSRATSLHHKDMRPAALRTRKRDYPQKYLPVPKNTFKNPDSAKARLKREIRTKRMSAEEITAMIHRSAREGAAAVKALRARVAASKAKKAQLLGSNKENENEGNSDSDNDDDEDHGEMADAATPTPDDHPDWSGVTITMPLFTSIGRQAPGIVVTSPKGAERRIQGDE